LAHRNVGMDRSLPVGDLDLFPCHSGASVSGTA
jgi:hypothetical protein